MVLLTSHKTDVYAKESGENESHTNGESRVGYWLHQHWCHAAKCLLLLLSDLDHLALPTEEKQFLYYTEDLSMVNITLIFHSFVTAPWPGLCRGKDRTRSCAGQFLLISPFCFLCFQPDRGDKEPCSPLH